jgi:GntR family transcriptional regulator
LFCIKSVFGIWYFGHKSGLFVGFWAFFHVLTKKLQNKSFFGLTSTDIVLWFSITVVMIVGELTLFIRIEPSSSVPIYRQIIDQIKYSVAAGVLKEGDKVPSVRELAATLAVNQNTILKVYNELCREQVLKIVRGDGTYVSSSKQAIPAAEREKTVGKTLREAVVQAIHLEVSLQQAKELLETEYKAIESERNRSK